MYSKEKWTKKQESMQRGMFQTVCAMANRNDQNVGFYQATFCIHHVPFCAVVPYAVNGRTPDSWCYHYQMDVPIFHHFCLRNI